MPRSTLKAHCVSEISEIYNLKAMDYVREKKTGLGVETAYKLINGKPVTHNSIHKALVLLRKYDKNLTVEDLLVPEEVVQEFKS